MMRIPQQSSNEDSASPAQKVQATPPGTPKVALTPSCSPSPSRCSSVDSNCSRSTARSSRREDKGGELIHPHSRSPSPHISESAAESHNDQMDKYKNYDRHFKKKYFSKDRNWNTSNTPANTAKKPVESKFMSAAFKPKGKDWDRNHTREQSSNNASSSSSSSSSVTTSSSSSSHASLNSSTFPHGSSRSQPIFGSNNPMLDGSRPSLPGMRSAANTPTSHSTFSSSLNTTIPAPFSDPSFAAMAGGNFFAGFPVSSADNQSGGVDSRDTSPGSGHHHLQRQMFFHMNSHPVLAEGFPRPGVARNGLPMPAFGEMPRSGMAAQYGGGPSAGMIAEVGRRRPLHAGDLANARAHFGSGELAGSAMSFVGAHPPFSHAGKEKGWQQFSGGGANSNRH